MTFKIEPTKLIGLSIHNILVGVLASYGQVFRESGDICMTMGFEGVAEYTEAYGTYLYWGSEHRHLLYPHEDIAEICNPAYLIRHRYFDYSEKVSYGKYSHGPVDSLLSSSLYDGYLEKLEPNGCMFLIRPAERVIAQLYGKDSNMYKRLSWICEDWGEEQ